MSLWGSGRRGQRVSLYLQLRCYTVTKSWNPLQEADFRRNRIRNAALRLRYKTTSHRCCFANSGRFAGKNLGVPWSSEHPSLPCYGISNKFGSIEWIRISQER